MSKQQPPFLRLPNELLMQIVEYIGPPDIERCDPGWLVFPTVCCRLRNIAQNVLAWNTGNDSSTTSYEWRTFSRPMQQYYSGSGIPSVYVRVEDKRIGAVWSFSPLYKGGNVDYLVSKLEICPKETHQDSRQLLDDYFGSPCFPRQPPRLQLSWISSILLECPTRGLDLITDEQYFSLANVPCIVSPALQDLYIINYVVYWRCNGLKSLTIDMDDIAELNVTAAYRYHSSHLLALMRDSRLTLEEVKLFSCLLIAPDEDEAAAPATHFPYLRDFEMWDIPPREAWLLCSRMIFPAGCPPAFYDFEGDSNFLHGLVSEYARSFSNVHPGTPSLQNGFTVLTFREARCSGRDLTITASTVNSRDPAIGFAPELYACNLTSLPVPFWPNIDSEDEKKLRGSSPGLEHIFVTDLCWALEAWTPPSSQSDLDEAQVSGLNSVQYVFISGEEWILRGANSAEIWTAVLRHLSNLRALYIHAPSSAALVPLIIEPDILPALETLWLGCSDEATCDIDARSLLDIVNLRERLRDERGRAFELRLVNVNIVGEAEDVQDLYRTRSFTLSNYVPV